MNCFRLVNPGFVDKMIMFDTLPKRLCAGIKMKDLEGFPRYWRAWLKENGCVRKVSRWNAEQGCPIEHEETFTYILDYKTINEDRERWEAITSYIRRAVDLKVRLMDKIEDMARPLANDPHSELSAEPEQVPIIPIPVELAEKEAAPRIIRTAEDKVILEPVTTMKEPAVVPAKKRGRPKKAAVEA